MGKGHISAATCCWLCCLAITGLRAEPCDKEIIRNLRWEWFFDDPITDRYTPKSSVDSRSLGFFISAEMGSDNLLMLELQGGTTVLVDSHIYQHFPADTCVSMPLASLLKKDRLRSSFVSLFNSQLDVTKIRTLLVRNSPTQSNRAPAVDASISYLEPFVISVIFVLLLFAAMKNLYARSYSEYFSLSRALAINKRDELLYKLRIFETPNMLMQMLTSMLVAVLVISFLIFLPASFRNWAQIEAGSTARMLIMFISISAAIFSLVALKWILIRSFGFLFKLVDFTVIHFVNGVRLTAILSAITLLLFGVMYLVFDVQADIYKYLLMSLVIFMVIRMVIIALKLLSFSTYKFLHLFSYLCGTEIIPLVIAFRVVVKVV